MKKLTIQDVQNEVKRLSPGESQTFYRGDLKAPPQDLEEYFDALSKTSMKFPDLVLEGLSSRCFYWVPSKWGYEFRRIPYDYPEESNYRSWVYRDHESYYKGSPGKYWHISGSWFDQSKLPILERVYYRIEDVQKDYSFVRYVGDIVRIPRKNDYLIPVNTHVDFANDSLKVDYDVFRLFPYSYWQNPSFSLFKFKLVASQICDI